MTTAKATLEAFSIRKIKEAAESYGTRGRRSTSSAEHGVFVAGRQVMRIWNESMGRRRDVACWAMEFLDESGHAVFELASSQSLAEAKERVPDALAAVGLIPGRIVPAWAAKFRRGGSRR